jgi:hypothetical protein
MTCEHTTIYRRDLHNGSMWICSLCGWMLGTGEGEPFNRLAEAEAERDALRQKLQTIIDTYDAARSKP